MHLRHAAALALVGWYLMWPPLRVTWLDWLKGSSSESLQKYAPLSEWSVHKAFSSPAECNAAQAAEVQDTMNDLQKDQSNDQLKIPAESAIYSQCIATDDPRLKGR